VNSDIVAPLLLTIGNCNPIFTSPSEVVHLGYRVSRLVPTHSPTSTSGSRETKIYSLIADISLLRCNSPKTTRSGHWMFSVLFLMIHYRCSMTLLNRNPKICSIKDLSSTLLAHSDQFTVRPLTTTTNEQ